MIGSSRVRLQRLACVVGVMLLSTHALGETAAPSPLSPVASSARRHQAQDRWLDCAVLWDRVARGQTQDTRAARQHAQYERAVCLARLGLTFPALRAAGALAGQPAHRRSRDAARLFAELTRSVPAPVRMLDEQRARAATLARSSGAPVLGDAQAALDGVRRQAATEVGRLLRQYLEAERRE